MTRLIWKGARAKQPGIVSWKSHAGREDKAGSRNATFLLLWLVGGIMVFALLYSASHIALLSLPKHEGSNMRSQLTADYNVWEDLEFQPVDPGIIEEIQFERDLPEQLIINHPDWVTPAPSFPSSSLTPVIDSSATPEQPSINPTGSQPPVTLTPLPTETVLQPQSTQTRHRPASPDPPRPVSLTKRPNLQSLIKHPDTSRASINFKSRVNRYAGNAHKT